MFNLTYEFKLKPTRAQIAMFEDWLEQCRRVYNYGLAERKDWIKSRSCQINACSLRSEYIIPVETQRPNYFNQCKALTQARAKYPELRDFQRIKYTVNKNDNHSERERAVADSNCSFLTKYMQDKCLHSTIKERSEENGYCTKNYYLTSNNYVAP